MTPLRKQMIEAMQMRGFSPRTHQSYLYAVTKLASYYHRSPSLLSIDELQSFFRYLSLDRHLSGSSCRLYMSALQFLYLQVLEWDAFDVPFTFPKKKQRLPELLTRAEVRCILDSCSNPKHRTMLTTCYGCGLRASELMAIKVRHIDGERRLLRVEQGKGSKDRAVVLSEQLLIHLRHYWQRYHPHTWLFPSRRSDYALSIGTAQKVYQRAKGRAGITKRGGIHSMRHAYATHQLEAGLPVHVLQHQLGHKDIKSTLRYVHLVPNYQQDREVWCDLIAGLEVDND